MDVLGFRKAAKWNLGFPDVVSRSRQCEIDCIVHKMDDQILILQVALEVGRIVAFEGVSLVPSRVYTVGR